jgi:hypothetical protein
MRVTPAHETQCITGFDYLCRQTLTAESTRMTARRGSRTVFGTSPSSRYPDARNLTITADCGGSNGAKVRLWKRELQRFANETDLSITVTHLPPRVRRSASPPAPDLSSASATKLAADRP